VELTAVVALAGASGVELTAAGVLVAVSVATRVVGVELAATSVPVGIGVATGVGKGLDVVDEGLTEYTGTG
jgi:hypothetical protein